MKIIGSLIGTAIIALTTSVILNTSNIKINAKELTHEKEVRELKDETLKENLDKQIKHLENIENYLRELTKEDFNRRKL